VEGVFAKLTTLKRGVFRSLVDLQVAINRFLAETNSTPKPFVRTADPKRSSIAVSRLHRKQRQRKRKLTRGRRSF
jgi:hypothetical protein